MTLIVTVIIVLMMLIAIYIGNTNLLKNISYLCIFLSVTFAQVNSLFNKGDSALISYKVELDQSFSAMLFIGALGACYTVLMLVFDVKENKSNQ